MKLLLFDIDGTMLHTAGLGRRGVERALGEVCGRPMTTEGIRFSGKTDPQILREVLTANGVKASPERMDVALQAYADYMLTRLVAGEVEMLPGVSALVQHLAQDPSVQLALLTGNLEPIAYLKLQAIGLDSFFPFGAFGSDHEQRAHLPAVAVRRANAYTEHDFRGKDVVIIGDTEHDITCGRGIGAFSVAVCTGHYSRDDLSLHGPDLLLDTLIDHDHFRRHVLRRAA